MLTEKHCEVCNKLFYANPLWAYQIKMYNRPKHWYCSYTCLNEGKRRLYKNRKRRSFGWRNGEK